MARNIISNTMGGIYILHANEGICNIDKQLWYVPTGSTFFTFARAFSAMKGGTGAASRTTDRARGAHQEAPACVV
eukprot:6183426-Pleurochrysis_carterae.AAC.2